MNIETERLAAVRGAGLATEAVRAALDFASAHGARVAVADTDESNGASRRVLEKADMVETHREGGGVFFGRHLSDAKVPSPSKPYLVLVVGRPASGKTTISTMIADRWNLPIASKDALKELLFDSLGTADRAWSMRLGRTAFVLLDHVIELQLRTGRPFLIDASYDAKYENAKFQAWQDHYGFDAVQVHCSASPDELTRRFSSRALDGTRHVGHADHGWVEEFRSTLTDGRADVLDLRGPVLEYDSEQPGSDQTLLRDLAALLPLTATHR